MLNLESVTAGYTEENIIDDVSLQVEKGEIVTIIGPNGSGKSTLMKSVFGLTKLRGGRIRVSGKGYHRKEAGRAGAAGTGLCALRRGMCSPALTVKENLEMGAISLPGGLKERLSYVQELFPMLAGRMAQRAGTLSGGSRRCWRWEGL